MPRFLVYGGITRRQLLQVARVAAITDDRHLRTGLQRRVPGNARKQQIRCVVMQANVDSQPANRRIPCSQIYTGAGHVSYRQLFRQRGAVLAEKGRCGHQGDRQECNSHNEPFLFLTFPDSPSPVLPPLEARTPGFTGRAGRSFLLLPITWGTLKLTTSERSTEVMPLRASGSLSCSRACACAVAPEVSPGVRWATKYIRMMVPPGCTVTSQPKLMLTS